MWEREGGREITFHNLSTEVLLTIYHRAVNRCTGVHTKMWSKHNTAYNIYYTILLIWYILYYLYDIYYTTYMIYTILLIWYILYYLYNIASNSVLLYFTLTQSAFSGLRKNHSTMEVSDIFIQILTCWKFLHQPSACWFIVEYLSSVQW